MATPLRRSRLPLLIGVVVVIATATFVTIQLRNRSDEARRTTLVPRPVTATTAYDGSPSWSPDGKFIAFSRMTSGNLDVYVKPVDGGDAVARAYGPGDQESPRWSPDGRHLAYVSSEKPGSSVFLVPPDGGKPKELVTTDLPALSMETLGARPWSIDGETLLVSKVTATGQIAVHRIKRATGEATQTTFPPEGSADTAATYSFDGKRIIFLRFIDGKESLMLMPAEGGDPELLHRDENIQNIAWRPDGRHVVFVAVEPDAVNETLMELDVETRVTRPLLNISGFSGLSVSADDRLVYSDFRHDTFLFVVDVETGEREQITSHTLNNFSARFAPDGRTIAYNSNRTGRYEVWLHHLDGRPETQFTDNMGASGYQEWSPDGRRLVFLSSPDGGASKMFIANADGGGGARLLIDQPVSSQSPRWSPDGESIAYLVDGGKGAELWTIATDGDGALRRLEGITGFDWYRTGRQGLVTRQRGSETELIAVDLKTGREDILFVGALMEFDVAPDGSAVAFCYGRGHLAMGLAVLELEPPSDPADLPRAIGEPEYAVRTVGTWHIHNGGWSPDSKRLVYTRDWDYGDIYELVERR